MVKRCHPADDVPISNIIEAARVIKSKVLQTPLIFSSSLSRLCGCKVYLKLENLQKTGSFKIRGAIYKLFKIRDRIGPGGIVAASAGNHAQGVALAAGEVGVDAFIIMPQWASITKQEATRSYGGRVIIHGQSVGESLRHAEQMAATGKTLIHPFDDADIIAGQGTVGLEIAEALPDADMVIAPIGGGGLLAGIAAAMKSSHPQIQIIGVQSKCCPSAYNAMRCGAPVTVEADPSVADGISVRKMGGIPFRVLRDILDDIILVEENDLIASILMLLERKKILVEGAGAAPLAALMNGVGKLSPQTNVVLVISGGNLDSPVLDRIIHRGLIKNGRIMRLGVMLDDLPGSLARLLRVIAGLDANVLHIQHERNTADMPLFTTHVILDLETRGPAHIAKISRAIQDQGYHIP